MAYEEIPRIGEHDVSRQECDICGEGPHPANGIKLCLRCTLLEEEYLGDLAIVDRLANGLPLQPGDF